MGSIADPLPCSFQARFCATSVCMCGLRPGVIWVSHVTNLKSRSLLYPKHCIAKVSINNMTLIKFQLLTFKIYHHEVYSWAAYDILHVLQFKFLIWYLTSYQRPFWSGDQIYSVKYAHIIRPMKSRKCNWNWKIKCKKIKKWPWEEKDAKIGFDLRWTKRHTMTEIYWIYPFSLHIELVLLWLPFLR